LENYDPPNKEVLKNNEKKIHSKIYKGCQKGHKSGFEKRDLFPKNLAYISKPNNKFFEYKNCKRF
jgi:hypothetical protein